MKNDKSELLTDFYRTLAGWRNHFSQIFNHLKTKCILFYIKNQSLPRCKQFSPRL